jgi:hypothetical protein
VIVDRIVKRVCSWVTRWKCLICRRTFTLYPDFALPHKRYVRQDVCRLCGHYVNDDRLSYRRAVEVHRMAVFHDAEANGKLSDRRLSPTTPHRWIAFLGGLKQTLTEAWRLIRAQSPGCDLFRGSTAVAPWKYRSEPRKGVLQTCGRLLQADQAYGNLFKISIFPHLGTGCRWS